MFGASLFCIFCCVLSLHSFSSAKRIDTNVDNLSREDQNALIDGQIENLRLALKRISSTDGDDHDDSKADLWRRLGLLLQSKDARQHIGGGALQPQALEAFNNALTFNQNRDVKLSAQVYHHRGMLLKMMGKGEEAIESHDAAYGLSKNNVQKADMLAQKGAALVMLGRVLDAIVVYKQALALFPGQTSSYLPLVQCYSEIGNMTTANWKILLTEIESAMQMNNHRGRLNRDEPWDDDDDYDDDDDEDNDADSSNVKLYGDSSAYFALFEVANKAGERDKAWAYLDKAHELEIARRDKFDESPMEQQALQLRSIFVPSFWPMNVGSKSKVPVFIVGMMRSGSTLLETMLDAHADIWGLGEDSIFNGKLPVFRNELVAAVSDPQGVDAVQRVVLKHSRIIVDLMLKMAKEDMAKSNAGKVKAKTKSSKLKHVVDKMLFNYRNIGFIHLLFPKAVILHTMRDPMDTLFSCYKHKFDDVGLEWSLDAGHLTRQYVRYLQLMQHFRKVLPGRVIDIRYEEVVADPEAVMRRVLHGLGLAWDPAVLNFHASNRTVHTHSQSQVRQRLYSKSIGSWRKYADQLKPIITELNKHLPLLRKEGGLPYADKINWALDPNFPYNSSSLDPEPAAAAATADSRVAGMYSIFDPFSTAMRVNDTSTDTDTDAIAEPTRMGGKNKQSANKKNTPDKSKKSSKSTSSFSSEASGTFSSISASSSSSSSAASAGVSIGSEPTFYSAAAAKDQLASAAAQARHHSSLGDDSMVSGKRSGGGVVVVESGRFRTLKIVSDATTERSLETGSIDNSRVASPAPPSFASTAASSAASGSKDTAGKSRGNAIDSLFDSVNKRTSTITTAGTAGSIGGGGGPSAKYTALDVIKALREPALADLYSRHNFLDSFGTKSVVQSHRNSLGRGGSGGNGDGNGGRSSSEEQMLAQRLKELIEQLKYHSKDRRVDELTVVGYQFVNTGKTVLAVDLFDELLNCLFFVPDAASSAEYMGGSVVRIERKHRQDSGENAGGNGARSMGTRGSKKGKKKRKMDEGKKNNAVAVPIADCVLSDDVGSIVNIGLGLGSSLAMSGDAMGALEVFADVLQLSPREMDVLSRRAEVLAAVGQFDSAIADLDLLVEDDDRSYERLFERGKVKFMKKQFGTAYADLNQARKLMAAFNANAAASTTVMKINPSGESVHEKIGVLDHPLRSQKQLTVKMWHLIAKCQKEFGDTSKAMRSFQLAYDAAVESSPSSSELLAQLLLDMAASLMEASRWHESLQYLERSIRHDSRLKNAYGYRGLLNQNLGRHEEAIADFEAALALDSRDPQCLYLSAMCRQAVGDFAGSSKYFERLLQGDPDHFTGFFRNEVMLYFASRANVPLLTFNADAELDPVVREGMVKPVLTGGRSKAQTRETARKSYAKTPLHMPFIASSNSAATAVMGVVGGVEGGTPGEGQRGNSAALSDIERLLKETKNIGEWVQLDSPGFLPNKRAHAAFGLGVLEMGQALCGHVRAQLRGEPGLLVPDSAASKRGYFGYMGYEACVAQFGSALCRPGFHVFGWRDFFDIFVRWRQLSEPMDAVWWIDLLPPKEDFRERVGLNTYLLHGTNKVIRYYTYFEAALNMTRQLMLNPGYFDASEALVPLTGKRRTSVERAGSLQDLHRAAGSRDFFVVVPCGSTLRTGRRLNGTRITLTRGATTGEGWDFSICSASTPERFAEYEEELAAVFGRVVSGLRSVMSNKPSPSPSPSPPAATAAAAQSAADTMPEKSPAAESAVLDAALDLFYYWVNFAPLSRGTSATGYAALYACVLAMGREIGDKVPSTKQLDWEAILSTTPGAFKTTVAPWLGTLRRTTVPQSWLWGEAEGYTGGSLSSDPSMDPPISVSSTFKTAAKITRVLTSASKGLSSSQLESK